MAGPQQDPFDLVKEEIHESVKKLLETFARWEQRPKISIQDFLELSKELYTGCENIEWQVDELDRAIAVAESDPIRFSLDAAEIERRKTWTSLTRDQIYTVRTDLQTAAGESGGSGRQTGNWEELIWLPDHLSVQQNRGIAHQNDDLSVETGIEGFMLREKDASFDYRHDADVEMTEQVGIEICTEMSTTSQDRLLEHSLSHKDMDHTFNRLDLLQKRVARLLKKSTRRAQVITVIALILVLILLTYLVING